MNTKMILGLAFMATFVIAFSAVTVESASAVSQNGENHQGGNFQRGLVNAGNVGANLGVNVCVISDSC